MIKSLMPSCFHVQHRRQSAATLVFWTDGSTRTLLRSRKHIAGEVMIEFPDHMVSHADSLFIGHPIRPLAIEDELLTGQTYFVLPIERFAYRTLTVSSLSIFNRNAEREEPDRPRPALNLITPSSPPPFEYSHGSNGRMLIKVSPSFIISLIRNNSNKELLSCDEDKKGVLCTTPELKRQYVQLVGSKEQVWSPKLETISEHETRGSPYCFIGLHWILKEI